MEYPFKDLLPLDEVLEREGYYKDWTHLDPKVFYSLTQISEYIKTKGFGVDVRLLIAQLAEHFGLKTAQMNEIERLFNDVMKELGEDKDYYSLPEIAGARRGYQTLYDSLNNLSFNMFNTNLGKVTPNMVSDELLAQIAGDAPVNAVPADGSLTTEKFADKSVTDDKIADGAVRAEHLVGNYLDVEKSWNLFDKTKAMDKKLVSTSPDATTIFDYPDAIYSNLVAVSEGDYVIYQKYRPVGEIFCYDNDKKAVTAINVLGGGHGSWPVPDGKITRENLTSGDLYVTRIKIIDTNVKYIAWHMHSGSYWSHTPQQFQDLIDSAQVSEGASIKGYTSFGWENYKIAKNALPELTENSTSKPFTVYKNGTQISIRTDFGDKDIAHLWKYPIENNNEGLNLIAIYTHNKEDPDDSLTGEMFKNSSDDIAPLHINGSYVGGNHGYFDLITLTATSHGKTTADIGSVWKLSGQAENYIIVDVVNADRIKIFSDFTGIQTSPTHYWNDTNGTLAHLEGATNTGTITFTQAIKEQLYPGANNKVVRFMLDGEEITEDGLFYGDKFKIEEGYTITDIPSIQSMMKNSKGVKLDLSSNDIPGMVRVVNIFNHNINGSLTIQSSFRFLKQTSIAFYGAIQSMAIGDKAYVPGVGVINDLDLSKVVTQGTSTLNFDKSSWLNPDKPPFRYHQFNDDLSKGMAIGYNTEFGVAKPDIRKNTSSAGNFNGASKKMYPHVKVGGTATEGEYHQVVSFRAPLRKIDDDATDVYWYWVGDDVYFAFDFHKSVNKSISVPDYLIGKKIEIIDIHENTKIYSDFVSVDGIAIEVLNGYGYGVVRLYD